MAKHIPRSRKQVALSRLLAEVAEAIAQPGPIAAAIESRFGRAATAPDASDADVAWRIRWPAGHALAGREFFTLDIKTAKTRVLEGALVEPLHGRFLRGVGLHLPGASGGEPELVQPPATWVDPKNEKTAAAERLHTSALDVVDETRRSTLLLQARSLELKAQMLQRPASASIAIDVLPDGRVLISSTCQGRPDSRYAPLDDQQAPQELQRLLGELREQLALPPGTEATHD